MNESSHAPRLTISEKADQLFALAELEAEVLTRQSPASRRN